MTDISDDFPALVGRFEDWLMDRALPLWAEQGLDRMHGGFFDLVDMNGRSVAGPRRGRVQGRQTWVFALAGAMGWRGPWQDIVRQGLDFALSHRRKDGQLPGVIAGDGSILDQTA